MQRGYLQRKGESSESLKGRRLASLESNRDPHPTSEQCPRKARLLWVKATGALVGGWRLSVSEQSDLKGPCDIN